MLAVIVAMQKEADVLLSHSIISDESLNCGKKFYKCRFNDIPFCLILSGVGKSNAAAATMLALTSGADRILNYGVAGGLTSKAKIGSVLQIEKAVEFDFDLSEINGTPVGTPDECTTPYFDLSRQNNSFPTGILASGDRFGCGHKDDGILQQLKADVRDMEGAAIAHIAYAAKVPCWIFKSISDNAGEQSVREYHENLQIALRALENNLIAFFKEACNE